MKRLVFIICLGFLLAPLLQAQESTPERPPVEPKLPGQQQPGAPRSSPPSQAVVPVPIPIAPPKTNGPVKKSLVRITATSLEPDYRAPWNAGALQGRGCDSNKTF